jgi:L-ornithine N5-monooxygenase
MLLPDTIMQISFLKDLATLRNPTSSFSFLSYLNFQGRLVSFINRGSFIPTRREFSDYLSWAAGRVQELGVEVFFSEQFSGVKPDQGDGAIQCSSRKDCVQIVRLASQYNTRRRLHLLTTSSENVVVAPGGVARIPQCMAPVMSSPQAMHTSTFATSIVKALETFRTRPRALRIAVVGSGQSAAEVFLNLKSRLSDLIPPDGQHELDLIIRKGSLKPSDDSAFANEIFDPECASSPAFCSRAATDASH